MIVKQEEPPYYASLASTFLYLYSHKSTDATHIFDGLNNFPTHVVHMRFGSFVMPPSAWPGDHNSSTSPKSLYKVALQWLKEDRDHRRELEDSGRKTRGARRNEVCLALSPKDQLFRQAENRLYPQTLKHSTESVASGITPAYDTKADSFQLQI